MLTFQERQKSNYANQKAKHDSYFIYLSRYKGTCFHSLTVEISKCFHIDFIIFFDILFSRHISFVFAKFAGKPV